MLEDLGIPYLVGGSLASSVLGEPRSTNDIDILADIRAVALDDTAEHSVLRKLEWYRRGGEVSDRQWRDVVAILRLQGDDLSGSHLAEWADRLGISDLLGRAMSEARRA